MLRAVETLLPRDEADPIPENPADRQELLIDRMDCQYFPELSAWFAGLKQQWAETHAKEEDEEVDAPEAPAVAAGEPAAEGGQPAAPPDATAVEGAKPNADSGPSGPGWVVELQGHHFHNEDRHKPMEGAQYVRSTLIKNLIGEGNKVIVSAGPLAGQEVSVSELGIGFPVIVQSSSIKPVRIPLAKMGGGNAPSFATRAQQPADDLSELESPQELVLRRYDFVVQFCWQPRPAGEAPPAAPAAAAAPGAAPVSNNSD